MKNSQVRNHDIFMNQKCRVCLFKILRAMCLSYLSNRGLGISHEEELSVRYLRMQ